jgi:hypothetical protein
MIITPDNDVNGPPLMGVVPVVFLAGGITGCPDWQTELIDLIEPELDPNQPYILANPRRLVWDMNSDSNDQIAWEYMWLDRADIISFWFPHETLCPITLYELADVTRRVMIDQDSQGDRLELVVGAHSDYQRRYDIEKQSQLRLGEDFHIARSLDTLSKRIVWRVEDWWKEHAS